MLNQQTSRLAALGLALTLVAAACGGSSSEGEAVAAVDVEGVGTTLVSQQADASSAETEAPATSEAAAATTQETTATTAAPAVEAAAVSIDDRFVGRTVSYQFIEFRLGSVITTEMDAEDYLSGNPDPDMGDPVILIEIAATRNIADPDIYNEASFQLIDAAGQRTAASDLLQRNGDRLSWFDPDVKATEEGVIAFPAIDLDGASLIIGETGFVQEVIPLTDLDTTPVSPLVLELESGQNNPDSRFANFDESCTHSIDTTIQSAQVTLDGIDRNNPNRAADGRRYVSVELAFTNTGNEPCNGASPALYRLEPRLNADGIGNAPTNSIDTRDADQGTTVVTTFWFDIDATATELVLTNLEGQEFASWTVEIPAAFGE